MRTFVFLAALGLVGSAFAQTTTTLTTTAGTYVINSNSFTGAATGLGGSANFSAVSPTGDNLFRNMWAYRQTGDTREYMVSGSTATFSSTVNTFTMTVDRNPGNTGANNLRFTLRYELLSLTPTSPMLVATMSVQNIGTTTTGVNLFNYADYDIQGGGADTISSNIVTLNGIKTRQSDVTVTTNYAEHWAEGANRYRHGTLFSGIFTDAVVTDLNNSVTAGSGDFGTGFQWNERTLAAGETTSIRMYSSLHSPVPEPASMTALGLGVAALLRRRKKS